MKFKTLKRLTIHKILKNMERIFISFPLVPVDGARVPLPYARYLSVEQTSYPMEPLLRVRFVLLAFLFQPHTPLRNLFSTDRNFVHLPHVARKCDCSQPAAVAVDNLELETLAESCGLAGCTGKTGAGAPDLPLEQVKLRGYPQEK